MSINEAGLAGRLRNVSPHLRTALLHHARGEVTLAGLFMENYLNNVPNSRRGDGPMQPADIAHAIVEWREHGRR